MFITVRGAYGRTYKNQAQIKKDWEDGKDFICVDMMHSGYINKNDAPKGSTINVRYAEDKKVLPIKTN